MRHLALSLACLCAAFAVGQAPLSLSPSSFRGSSPSIALVKDGQARGWRAQGVAWAFVRGGETQENRDTVAEWLQPSGSVQPPMPARGSAVVGIDFAPVVEKVSGRGLSEVNGLPGIAGEAKARHYRSAVAILRVGSERFGQAAVTAKTGLSSEIRLMMDPGDWIPGASLAFRPYVRGEAVSQPVLVARHLASGEKVVLRGNESGACHFEPAQPGAWEVSFQYLGRLEADPEASLELFSATVTFEVGR